MQGHQELSGKSDKNNSLKPNQTTPSEHCHFQRLRAKPNFLRLSRTELIWIQDLTLTNVLWFEENRKVIWESADCFRYIPINKAVKWGRWRGALIKTAVKLTFHTMMGGKNFYSLFINTMPVNIRGGEGWLEELQKTSRESLVKRKAESKRRE